MCIRDRNKGIDISNGDYICFLGADDQFYNESVLDEVVQFIKDTNMKVVCGKIMYVMDDYKVMKAVGQVWESDDIKKGCMYPHPGMFVESGILKKYRFNIYLKIASDYELLLRLVCDGVQISFCDKIITYFHANGISSNNRALAFEEKYRCILQWCGRKYAEPFRKSYRRYLLKIYIRNFLLCIGVGRIFGYRRKE